MSKVIYAYSRNYSFNEELKDKLKNICDIITPDNISGYKKHTISIIEKTAFAVTLINEALHYDGLNLLIGFLYEELNFDWKTVKYKYPDGNYSLFRQNDIEIELVSDGTGSRTIWYYYNEELFIASSSQRAIILFINNFDFDERVIPWMLSTGSLGPELSWDKRIRRLQPNSSLVLNKTTWKLSISYQTLAFKSVDRSEKEHRILLYDTIKNTFKYLENLNFEHWILPLSGGYDSRGILIVINELFGIPKELKTVTWGTQKSLNEDKSDAIIAKKLSKHFNVKHEYYINDISTEPIEKVLDRFILCSEGRIDHLAGYLDGMEIWKRFYDDKIHGIIRGDEGFGIKQVSSELTVRLSVGCQLCSDYENLKKIFYDFGFQEQTLPTDLLKKNDESIYGWRDRLYHVYRLPTILAALSDIKNSYIEQINPFLSKSILSIVRTIPDNLRTDKKLFKKIVKHAGPEVPFATKSANIKMSDIFKKKDFIELVESEINSNYAMTLLGPTFIKFILEKFYQSRNKTKSIKQKARGIARSCVPNYLRNILYDKNLSINVNAEILALRIFIIIKVHKFLMCSYDKLKK